MKKRIVGLLLIAASLSCLGFWEFWGREYFSCEKILVLREDAARNVSVEENMLEIVLMEHPPEDALRADAAN